MSSPKAAPGAAASNVAVSLAALLSPARAEASRRNGAKSKGPKSPKGKARSAQNALRHGLRAQKHVVLPDEDAAEFAALEQAIVAELAPDGALQMALAQRVVAATWRLARAERIEHELFAIQGEDAVRGWGRLGLALIRDCNGARAFDTLLRYRGGTLAELWRPLRTLKALQAERAAQEPMRGMRGAEPAMLPSHADAGIVGETTAGPIARALSEPPNEPEARAHPGQTMPAAAADEPRMTASAPDAAVRRAERIDPLPGPRSCTAPAHPSEPPKEPEAHGNPGETAALSGPGGGEVLVGEPEARPRRPGEHDSGPRVGLEGQRASDLRPRCAP